MIRFDTLKFAQRVAEAGLPREAAEAIAAGLAEADTSELATKHDVAALRAELKMDIAELRTELKTDISELKAEMFRFMLVQGVGIVGLTVALVKLLPG
jgi:hypothetical protein